MSQCVPRWDLDGDAPATSRRPLRSPDTSASAADIPQLDYEVTELTWENGQLALHGLGPPRVPARQQPLPATSQSSPANYAWDNHKPRGSGTLESIVNPTAYGHKLVPWFDHHNGAVAMDGLVPCPSVGRPETEQRSISVRNAGYTPVGSCSGPVRRDEENFLAAKRARMTAAAAGKWSGMDQISVSGSARDDESRRVTFGTYDTTSLGSPEKTKTTAGDDCDDSVCHCKPKRVVVDEEDKKKVGKSSASTKRRRAAAIHNQSERKRRDKINQRMETLQKLVPNSSKTDKASLLDEVIEYLNQLQAQVNMMSRMNMPSMMLPMAMQQQQQLQMSMMAMQQQIQMSGMGMMDMNIMNTMNTMNRPATNMMPNPFMPMAAAASSWDNVSNENPMAAFLSCQSQPMTMDAYTQMAALYQQLQQQQQPVSSRKS